VLHAPPSSSSSTSLFYLYLAKSINQEAPRYAVFSTLPSPHPSSIQISISLSRLSGKNRPSQQLFKAFIVFLYLDRYMFRPSLAIIRWNTIKY
jgi:hypothetical protein